MTVAILALQGAFLEQEQILERLHIDYFEIRQSSDLNRGFDGLILPGGESTAMGKLLCDLSLFAPLKQKIAKGLPVLGTCAGAILLARQVEGSGSWFGTMDITVRRNAYGRQLGSFHTNAPFGDLGTVPMTFIRAPRILSVQGGAMPLAHVKGHIVAARQENQLALSFHPELCDDLRIHSFFLEMIREHSGKNAL